MRNLDRAWIAAFLAALLFESAGRAHGADRVIDLVCASMAAGHAVFGLVLAVARREP